MSVVKMVRPLDFSGYKIPEHTQGAMRRYVEDGLLPGGFLTAVLCNDLFGAIGRADAENLVALQEICMFVYNCLPGDCWGNEEKVWRWTEFRFYGNMNADTDKE